MDERRAWIAAAVGGVAWGLALWVDDRGIGLVVGSVALGGVVRGTATDPLRVLLFATAWQALALAWFPETWVAFGGPGGAAATGLVVAGSAAPWVVGLACTSLAAARGLPLGFALGTGLAVGTALAGLGPLPIVPAELAMANPALGWPAAVAGRVGFSLALGAVAGLLWERPRHALGYLALWAGVGAGWQAVPLSGRPLRVGIVETGVGAFEARRPSSSLARQGRLREALAGIGPADLLVAPEGALDGSAADWPALPPVVIGADRDGQNTLVVVAGGQEVDRFAKILLVPGTERRAFGQGRDRYRPGTEPRRLSVQVAGEAVHIAPFLCYEDLFGGRIPGDTDLVLTAANDGWNPRAAWAHLAASRLLAVETGLWVVRPTTSGISAAIDPRGRLVWSTSPVDRDSHPDAGSVSTVIRLELPARSTSSLPSTR